MKARAFFDLDGCLIDGNYQYTIELAMLRSLVERAKSLGVELSVNSNRSLKDILPFYEELGFNGIIIGENGSFAYDPKTKQGQVFTTGSASEIVAALRSSLPERVDLQVINTSAFVGDPAKFSFSDGEIALAEESRNYTGSVYCRKIASGRPEPNEALRAKLRAALDLSLPQYDLLDSSNCVLTVVPKDCDKTKPMQRGPEEWVCAIGDGVTDIPVLRFADFSAAPANAKPEVKDIVNYVSPKSVTAGSYDFLERVIERCQNE